MIRFAHPEAFLLLVLAALLLRRSLWPRPLLGALRALLLVLSAALLAQPYRFGGADGRDLVVVLDASRSMPASSRAAAAEFAGEVQRLLEPGDRLALVEFGRRAAVAVQPAALFAWPQTPREVDPEGSDLGQALATAAALVPPGRQGSVLLWSDGEHTAADPEPAARALRRAGLRLDAMAVRQPPGRDVAVADLSAPGEVAIGQPFVLTAFVQSDGPGRARWRLLRDGQPAGEGDVELAAGRTVVQTRQSLREPGVHAFAFEVDAGGDARPANDRGLCAVRAAAPPAVLCVTPGGREDRLTRSLRAAGHAVDVAAPGSAPLHLDALDAVRCVVLENVAAQELPAGALAALRTFVRDLGGGLLMTGGEASFGVGGYHRSAVEEVLPVTMEMREEQRRFALAMAIALDRSGSMAMAAGTGTKMDLADSGAAAAVELLSRLDSVAVIAIDSEPHVVVPMTPVTDKGAIAENIRRIDSGGGGIYVDVALEAAARELAAAKPQRRHLVLFADAADAEQPGDYRAFVPKLAAAGVTVSVIGLGSATDSDGALLQEIAKLGHGRCQFVAEPADLPRVFAQETIQVAKSAMVEEPAALRTLTALQLLGDLPRELPAVGGYSLAWLRPLAEQAVVTVDEQRAPLLSSWQCGLGRGAAFLGEADGRFSGGWQSFAGYAQFFGTLVRWLQGGAQQGVFADFRREGDRGVLTVEVEDALAAELDRVRGVVSGPDGGATDVVFERTGAAQLRAEVPLRREGVYRAAVQAGGAALRVPPVCLPYSPEYAPRLDPVGGERLLRRLCALTGGRVDPTAAQVVAGDRRALGRVDLAPACALAALVLLLLEIAVRRFDLRLRAPVQRSATAPALPAGEPVSAPAAASPEPIASKAPLQPPAEPVDATLAALERARRKRG